jgi:rhamnosyl/mannosyltransferase
VEFLGRISDSEKRAYYKACDFICFPSITRNEGFGLALAEGMFFGKPAITFFISGSGVNYVNLANVTGLECPNCDSQAYAEALKKLTCDEELRKQMGKAAKQRVEENFTPERFRKNVLELLRNL